MGKFWKSIGKAIASIPFVGNAIKSAKKGAQTIKKEAKKLAQKVETKLGELKESAEELLEELEESVEEALGKVTTYARKLKNNLDELALVQWLKKDAKTFVLAAYKKTKNWVKGGWKEGVSMIVDFCPGLGNLKGAYEAAYGKDPITGRKLSKAERAISGAAIIGGPFVKGAKHLGKGAMKIIPGSSKLADTLSKPLTKLKDSGKQVMEKVTAKAKELKAQANTAMAQMKQKIQTGMDKLGDMLNGNKPQLATAGANGMKAGAKKESDSLVQMSTNKSGGSEKGVKGTGEGTVIRSTEDSINRINQIRQELSVGSKRNIAFAEYEINGKKGELIGVSGNAERAGTVGVPEKRIFDTITTGNNPRTLDSEVKILENLASNLSQQASGKVYLFSELPFCISCSGVIEQFKKRFPNIDVIIDHGPGGSK
ncbi:pre-toxin TG domain-containing protein [Bacillus ndiopicus]|uniref:pre-toxin TG domain-containing protein n=1 Tax=Bacillus ndiopicus TaxID=1347368 RepID=UPI000694A204|nr:pre-toxin TG domain-containing protein [Bacillus ndiopicus]